MRASTPPVAGIAQLVEHLICNQAVVGSNPSAGSIPCIPLPIKGEGCADEAQVAAPRDPWRVVHGPPVRVGLFSRDRV